MINKVTLLGNAGRDAKIRYMPSGEPVANVSIATSSKRKDKTTGQYIEDVQWHRLVFFGKTAEAAGKYITKGKQIYVEGRIKYGSYKDKSGVEKHTTDIVVYELKLLGSRDDAPQGQQSQQQSQPPAQDFDDDQIPF